MSKLADTKHIKALERENRKLRTELSKSELHERFLETMIDIAERNFNIPIKKSRHQSVRTIVDGGEERKVTLLCGFAGYRKQSYYSPHVDGFTR